LGAFYFEARGRIEHLAWEVQALCKEIADGILETCASRNEQLLDWPVQAGAFETVDAADHFDLDGLEKGGALGFRSIGRRAERDRGSTAEDQLLVENDFNGGFVTAQAEEQQRGIRLNGRATIRAKGRGNGTQAEARKFEARVLAYLAIKFDDV